MLNLKKYQAFNMSNDYKQQVDCPYGCSKSLIEEQLLTHVTKCWKKNDELFGHCKYNYMHILLKQLLPIHEENCSSNIPMSEEDFAYKPDPQYHNQNLSWIEDDVSKLYAKYFVSDNTYERGQQQSLNVLWQSLGQDNTDEQKNQMLSISENENENDSVTTVEECRKEYIQLVNNEDNDSDSTKIQQLYNKQENIQQNNQENIEIVNLYQQKRNISFLEKTINFFKRILNYIL